MANGYSYSLLYREVEYLWSRHNMNQWIENILFQDLWACDAKDVINRTGALYIIYALAMGVGHAF